MDLSIVATNLIGSCVFEKQNKTVIISMATVVQLISEFGNDQKRLMLEALKELAQDALDEIKSGKKKGA